MQIKVKYFGKIAEIVGQHETVDNGLKNKSLQDYKDRIEDKFPKLKDVSFQIALNQDLVALTEIINEGDELALLPPFAGG